MRYIKQNKNLFKKTKNLHGQSKAHGLFTIIFILALFFFNSITLGSGREGMSVVKEYDLNQIKEIGYKFGITITDWQYHNYKFKFDEKKLSSREILVKWLKENLYNWGLEETKNGARFFLLPVGLEAKDFLNLKNSFKDLDYKKIFDGASYNFKTAKPINNVNILKLKEVEQLSNIAKNEQKKNLFFIRTVKAKNTEKEYTFSLAYNKQKDKFLPYKQNGSPVAENKMEGFVCYDTVLKYIKRNAKQFEATRSGSWIYLHVKGNSDSFMGLSSSVIGLDVVSLTTIKSKPILKYYIKGVDTSFNSATFIPTSGKELILIDSVSYLEGKTP